MAMLSVAEYDRAEAQALSRLTYPQIRAFAPAAFMHANFPTRVADERELLRYCDIMHELGDADYHYRKRLYSKVEAELIAEISRNIETLTGTIFQRPTQPFMSLFPPLDILRVVTTLVPEGAAIYEIGPGSGILGAYLIKRGYRYHSSDNTQALYLWQTRLFAHLAGASFSERVTDNRNADIAHIPWWHLAELFKDPPAVDLMICEAAMGEMESFAVWYLIRLAARMLARSPVGALLYCNVGEQRISTLDHIEQIFALAGFRKHRCGPVTVQSLRPLALPETPAFVGGEEGAHPACAFLPIDEAKLLDSYAFFDFMGLGSATRVLRTP
jgi:hypothetical protein